MTRAKCLRMRCIEESAQEKKSLENPRKSAVQIEDRWIAGSPAEPGKRQAAEKTPPAPLSRLSPLESFLIPRKQVRRLRHLGCQGRNSIGEVEKSREAPWRAESGDGGDGTGRAASAARAPLVTSLVLANLGFSALRRGLGHER